MRFLNCDIRATTFKNSKFDKCEFVCDPVLLEYNDVGLSFKSTSLKDVTFKECTFERVNFKESILDNTIFVDCSFSICRMDERMELEGNTQKHVDINELS